MADTRAPAAATGLRRLFIRKSVAQMHADHERGELRRSLSAINLISLGIGCIIGTGIFVLTGRAAAEFAGPGIMISFVITGVLCAFVALCYAELASMVPVSGSAYSYSYASMGEIAAWIMGLLLVLEYGLAASTVAVGWSGYVVSLVHDLGIHISPGSHRGAGSRGQGGRRSGRRGPGQSAGHAGHSGRHGFAHARRFGIRQRQQRDRADQGFGRRRLHWHRHVLSWTPRTGCR